MARFDITWEEDARRTKTIGTLELLIGIFVFAMSVGFYLSEGIKAFPITMSLIGIAIILNAVYMFNKK